MKKPLLDGQMIERGSILYFANSLVFYEVMVVKSTEKEIVLEYQEDEDSLEMTQKRGCPSAFLSRLDIGLFWEKQQAVDFCHRIGLVRQISAAALRLTPPCTSLRNIPLEILEGTAEAMNRDVTAMIEPLLHGGEPSWVKEARERALVRGKEKDTSS